MQLEQFLPLQAYAFIIIFTRLAGTVMLLPGLGEAFAPVRVRLLFAILLTIVAAPVIETSIPPEPKSLIGLFVLLAGELLVGVYLGLISRIMLLTLDTAGRFVSMSIGMANAQVFNPSIANQASIPGLLLTTLGIMLLFATNMHHTLIIAVIESYTLFPVGNPIPSGDAALVMSRMVGDSFKLGLQLSAPFIVLSLVFFMGLGILARLMPQLQIFFVGLPVQLAGGLFLFAACLSGLFTLFLEYYADGLNAYLTVG
ncbi:flagellar biosynthetic protein FliR [Alphaproteobacteria bacterium]|nr:flagellar biosynthetic protein FliR [Alphaproteobacteria bacterium]